MQEIKKQVTLQPDPLGYPWQSVVADGTTWVILRKRVRLDKELQRIGGLTLENMGWESAKGEERCLCRGRLELKLYYLPQTQEIKGCLGGDTDCGDDNSWELMIKEGSMPVWPDPHKREASASNFEELFLDEIKRELPYPADTDLQGVNIELPWQAWFYGEKDALSLSIAKAHVAQVGLYTVLVEIALKLGENDKKTRAEASPGKGTLTGKEEILYSIRGERAEEILDIVFERAFYSCVCDKDTNELILQNLRRDSLVFINAYKGGERFLTASYIDREQHRIAVRTKDLEPAAYKFRVYSQKTAKIDKAKVACKVDFILFAGSGDEKFLQEKDPRETIVVREEKKPAPLPVPRKKPGERWQRIGERKKKEVACKKIVFGR